MQARLLKILIFILLVVVAVNVFMAKIFSLASPVTIATNLDESTNMNGQNTVRDSSGNLYIVYYKIYNGYFRIFYAKSTDNGASWVHSPQPIEGVGNYHQA